MRPSSRRRGLCAVVPTPLLIAALAGIASGAPTGPLTSPAQFGVGAPCIGPCAHGPDLRRPPSPMERAIDALAGRSDDPGATRYRLLTSLRYSQTCYAPDLTQEQWEQILRTNGALPPGVGADGERFFTDTTVWLGNGAQGPSGRARSATLTYSFPDDGITWGVSGGGLPPPGTNNLTAMFVSMFGAANVDRGREYIRQSFAGWGRVAGLTYFEVADDNTPMTSATQRVGTRGDIRIGGFLMGNNGILAYNSFPANGSDMAINTTYQGSFASATNNLRYFRNVIAHEHGHGLGYYHAVPCNGVFLMEPSISTNFDMLTVDERRGAGANYGDRYAGNQVATTAKDFGDLTDPIIQSVIEHDLSTNGVSGFNNSSQDWFRFTLSSPQPVVISATPTGGVYTQGQQTFGCSGSLASVNAAQAGNLNIELRDAAGTSVLQTAAAAGPGAVETLSAGTLPAGTYTVRVFDVGPNPAANQVVQLYNLSIRVATAPAPPEAVAGINKRCAANTNCFFMGNINSRALEPGASIPGAGYAWDLDGDGTFEASGGLISRQYPSNGFYPVTLRVTDSNGRQGFDTIQVVVFGATTAVTAVAPVTGATGQSVPITLTGTNFKNVNSASMVTVSGTGVTVTGTPQSNALGTQLTGLSLVIAGNAAPGTRDITVSNADGTGTGVALFTITGGAPPCPADWNGDTVVNSSDLSAFITSWLDSVQNSNLIADFNNDGAVNSSDLSAFITAWLAAVQNGC